MDLEKLASVNSKDWRIHHCPIDDSRSVDIVRIEEL